MAEHGWLFWALTSAVFAALTAIFAKVGLQGIDSDFATFIRTLVIVAALALFLSYSGKWQNPATLSVKNWGFLVLSGLATGASWLAYFKALQLGDASKVAPVDKFSLVLVALMAVIFLKERPSAQEWLGIVFVASGVLLLALRR
ncbi:EamA family transporter [Neisseria montereyensis]|uniref:EamA family transporter n=1 Tax=Neisseria montereyensis TaxID=2973938 RepID=A0ABT2FBS5_9NEIS|nr:EamA family transporter [Neisseria montereyensis]MCS4533420.1 EamA family transporter [Neisseria montereyensis]